MEEKIMLRKIVNSILLSKNVQDNLSCIKIKINNHLNVLDEKIDYKKIKFRAELDHIKNRKGFCLKIYLVGHKGALVAFESLSEDIDIYYKLSKIYADFMIEWDSYQNNSVDIEDAKFKYQIWFIKDKKLQPFLYYANTIEDLERIINSDEFKEEMKNYDSYQIMSDYNTTTNVE